MATIIKHGDGYQAKIRRKGFPPVNKTFPTKTLAKNWATTLEAEMLSGSFVCRNSANNTTLGEALERYKNEVSPEKASPSSELYRVKFLQKQPFAIRPLSSLKPADFIHYRDERRKSLRINLSKTDRKIADSARRRKDLASLPSTFFVSDCTVRKELRLISHLFNIAKRRWNIFVENPIESIELPPEGKPRTIRIQPNEYEKLMTAFDTFTNPYIKPLVLFLIETALRRGEALSLLWEDVHIEKQFVFLRKGKNQHPRQVPLSTRAIAILKDMPRKQEDLVIYPITGNVVKLSMRHALKRAGLEKSGICTHTLRHEACSRLGDLGLTPIQIAGVSGHRTLQLVARYTHLEVQSLANKLG